MCKYSKFCFIQILFLTLFSSFLSSQSYNIKVKINGYTNDTLLLGYHYGDKQYIRDTAYKKNNEFVFKGDTLLEPGMYLIVTKPDHNYAQVLVDKDKANFSIETKNIDLTKYATFKNSKLNTDFFDYITFVGEKRMAADSVGKKMQASADTAFKKKCELELNKIDSEVKSHQEKVIKDQGKSLLATLINSTKEVDLPEFKGTKDEIQEQNYKYYKAHYFDYMDFTDDRIVRLPFFQGKLDKYFANLIMQHPDSISKELDFLLSRCKGNNDVFKYILSTQLSAAANSKYVGMDGVYVHLVENYYGKGLATWIDDESLAKIIRDANALKPLLIDKIAPDFVVYKKDSTPVRLHGINSEYIVLLIWAPDCSHCKKSMHHFVDFYEKYKSKGVEVLAICNKSGPEEKSCWEEKDFKLGNWINTSDPHGLSTYRYLYDVKSTPQVYILDKNKKILTKKIAGEQIIEVMEKLFKIKENESN
ncbi:MAG: redoxin domain-containing protein [Saprospiraceae bacterium]|nr:redoxin domain-containing protein [Saprospiraceae bacterium]